MPSIFDRDYQSPERLAQVEQRVKRSSKSRAKRKQRIAQKKARRSNRS